MVAYYSTGGKSSGVAAFETSADSITIKFKNGTNIYTPTQAPERKLLN